RGVMNKNSKGLWAILAPVQSIIALAMAINAVSVVFRIGSLVLLASSLVALLEKQPLIVFGLSLTLTNTLLLLMCLVVLAFLGKNLSFILSHLGAFRLEQILRIELSAHLARVPLGCIIIRTSGGLKKVMQDDVKKLHSFVADSTPMMASAVVSPVVSVVLLFWADWRLALASIFVLIFGFTAMKCAFKDSEYYRKKYEQSQTDINKAVVEFVQAMPVVRTFEDGTSSFTRYNEALQSYRTNLDEWTRQTTVSSRVGMIILTPLPTLLVVFLAGIVLQNFAMLDLTSFILALFLSTGLADALMPLMWMNIFIKQSQAAAFKIFEILEITELPETKTPKSPANYEVQFEDVSFAYENTTKNA
ncbi:MAG: ABC transporter ATP-binding protein/permease, partial [Deltaproteobacteria bacterium]